MSHSFNVHGVIYVDDEGASSCLRILTNGLAECVFVVRRHCLAHRARNPSIVTRVDFREGRTRVHRRPRADPSKHSGVNKRPCQVVVYPPGNSPILRCGMAGLLPEGK